MFPNNSFVKQTAIVRRVEEVNFIPDLIAFATFTPNNDKDI